MKGRGVRRLAAILLLSGIATACSPEIRESTAQSPDWLIGQERVTDAIRGPIRTYEMERTLGGVTVRYTIGTPESDSRHASRGFTEQSGDCRRDGDASFDVREPLARRAVLVEGRVQAQLEAMRADKCPIGPAASGILDGFRAAYIRVEQMAAIDAPGGSACATGTAPKTKRPDCVKQPGRP